MINTMKIARKLEEIVDYRIGEGSSERYPLVIRDKQGPATDGNKIYLPKKEDNFKEDKENELMAANSTAHEADHIREYNEYFGDEAHRIREGGGSVVQTYHERNYSELKENPALAAFIDNIVKDRRIDDERKNELPGVKRHFKLLDKIAEHLRPSIKKMSGLNAFMEQYVQKSLFGRTIEPVPKKYSKALDKAVKLTNSSTSINTDPEIVKDIYDIFKENFDITQKMSKLPNPFGRGNGHSEPQSGNSKGKPQEGDSEGEQSHKRSNGNDENSNGSNSGNPQSSYEGKIEEREDRPYENPPKEMKGSGEPSKTKEKEDKDSSGEGKDEEDKMDEESKKYYDQAEEENGMPVSMARGGSSRDIEIVEKDYEKQYYGEVSNMKRIFRQLQLKHYGEKRDFEGDELDYQDYMQSDLESKITKIKGDGRYFRNNKKEEQKPVFGIHADISGSTHGEVIENIKAAFYIVGNALSASDWHYGMYVSANDMKVVKDPTQKWSERVNRRIAGLDSGGGGIYLDSTNQIISKDLKRIEGNPRCMVVISDFEACGDSEKERNSAKEMIDSKVYPFYIAIGQEHEAYAKDMTSGIGDEHYSVIPTDKLYELPNEMFRLFKTFGVAK